MVLRFEREAIGTRRHMHPSMGLLLWPAAVGAGRRTMPPSCVLPPVAHPCCSSCPFPPFLLLALFECDITMHTKYFPTGALSVTSAQDFIMTRLPCKHHVIIFLRLLRIILADNSLNPRFDLDLGDVRCLAPIVHHVNVGGSGVFLSSNHHIPLRVVQLLTIVCFDLKL